MWNFLSAREMQRLHGSRGRLDDSLHRERDSLVAYPSDASMEVPRMADQPNHQSSSTVSKLDSSGTAQGSVDVTVGPRFLELFSENLYGSPNKAFEELVSNSWDAGATNVHIHIPNDLTDTAAAIWVYDDGESMDLAGLKQLWAVADSNKRANDSDRPQIGKFGIGKLSTYILANEITYICRACDGLVRTVTMDYRTVTEGEPSALHRAAVTLNVRVITQEELRSIANTFSAGEQFFALATTGCHTPHANASFIDEFGGALTTVTNASSETWTLALLSSLKTQGQSIQPGRLRWMLRTALPLNESVTITLNQQVLLPSKINKPTISNWHIGPGLNLKQLELEDDTVINVEECSDPYPHLVVDGLESPITGTAWLYRERITGGKSDALGASNGFAVNICGRVINPTDPAFGLENLSHGAWAQFRASIRCDDLDGILSVHRNGIKDSPKAEIFRALLLAIFNKARRTYNSNSTASWPSVGEVLTGAWQAVPLAPFADVVEDILLDLDTPPLGFDTTKIKDADEAITRWHTIRTERPVDVITDVLYEDRDREDALFVYDIESQKLIINSAHPFVRQHSVTHEEKVLIRELALVDLLTDSHLLDSGISAIAYEEVVRYRDRLLRLMAQLNRRSGSEIAFMLNRATADLKGLEVAIAESLRYLGFDVRELGGRGEPDGIARASLLKPSGDEEAFYSLTYEAKSTTKNNNRVSNKDVGASRVNRQRRAFGGDHALVIAPDFESGALSDECTECDVTPMRAADLARLLMYSATHRLLMPEYLRSVFALHDPDDVKHWVDEVVSDTHSHDDGLALDVFLTTIAEMGFEGPDTISASVIASKIREKSLHSHISRTNVRDLVTGLSVLVPSLIRNDGYDVFLSVSPSKLRETLLSQIGQLPAMLRFGIDEALHSSDE